MSSMQDPIIRPELIPLAPLIYVAWADADLSAAEIAALRKAATALPMISGDVQSELDRWTDPSSPPSARDLVQLRNAIAQYSASMPRRDRTSLAAVCRNLALASGAQADAWTGPAVQRALTAIDETLGLVGLEALQALLPGESEPAAQDEADGNSKSPGFDVGKMTALLDGTHADVRARIEGILADEQFRYRYGIGTPAYRELVLGWSRALADAGVGKLAFPGVTNTHGSLEPFIMAFQTLATFDLSLLIKVGVQFGLFGGSIYNLGTAKHHEKYLHGAADLSIPGCFAMTEQGHGSDVRSIRTRATWDQERGGFVIHTPDETARKEWIGNAANHGHFATVFAQLYVGDEHHDVHAFVVPIRDKQGASMPGVRIGDCGEKLGLNGVDNGRLWFDEVFVERDSLLDRYGSVSADGAYSSPIPSPGKRFFTMLGTLVGGRVSVGAAGVSVAKSALTIAVRYGDRRRQFDDGTGREVRLLRYPSHQIRLMPLVARTYALHFAFASLAARYGGVDRAKGPDRDVEALAAAYKAAATDHATQTVQIARECCGGQGYATANRFAHLKADSDVFTTFEGDNTVLRQLVGRGLLTKFRARFSDNRVAGMARFILERASQSLTEANPVIARNTSESHLTSPQWHADLLHARQSDLVTTAATRLQKRVKSGMPIFDAFTSVQLHVLAAANAWSDEQVVTEFARVVEAQTDPSAAAALRKLYELDVLTRIRDDLGWFLENGYIVAPKARAIRRLHEQRCAEVAEHALLWVDAFAIPDYLLGAPIGAKAG